MKAFMQLVSFALTATGASAAYTHSISAQNRDAPDVNARPIALNGTIVGTYWDFDSGIDFQGFPFIQVEDEQNPGHYIFQLYAVEGDKVLGLEDNVLTVLDRNNTDASSHYNIFTVTDPWIVRLDMPGGWVAVRTATTELSWQDPFKIMWDDKQNMSKRTAVGDSFPIQVILW
ncbi:hypothetical protein O1611_g989 [Lasiodiplodia mahajangana]|uniref:Uncharacterized protein n=1 Tax=Lasiodiplodia mahajangana TaxID=1108764 RepID=A0ACC2JZA1_9PEZI|nr:hypothetical protein O1611_g989 [Lasiodiplodia mahajangana]